MKNFKRIIVILGMTILTLAITFGLLLLSIMISRYCTSAITGALHHKFNAGECIQSKELESWQNSIASRIKTVGKKLYLVERRSANLIIGNPDIEEQEMPISETDDTYDSTDCSELFKNL